MSKLVRYNSAGQVYFITSVTHRRAPILLDFPDLIDRFLDSLRTRQRCDVIGWVFMPDHTHMLLDPKESDLSIVLKRAKLAFAYAYRKRKGMYRGTVWQPRFWDHIIRDETDYRNHLDYIHFNAVKHGNARAPRSWAYSSFAEFVGRGQYQEQWGETGTLSFDGQYGE